MQIVKAIEGNGWSTYYERHMKGTVLYKVRIDQIVTKNEKLKRIS